METIKKYLIIGLACFGLICGGLLYFSYNHIKTLDASLIVATNNYKAEVKKNLTFQYTLNDLQDSKDSSDIKVLQLAKELNIQPKKIVSTVYIASEFIKKDTIKLTDSIFVRDYTTKLSDDWYSLDLQFKYPNTFISDLKIKNEVVAITYDRKETVNPAKKFFLWRWLQKKQIVQVIEVKELNPYSTVKEFKFIKVIK